MYILTAMGNGPYIENVNSIYNDLSEAKEIANNLLFSGNYSNIRISEQ